MYDKLSADQVTTTYNLLRFLERLRIIGHLSAHTEQSRNVCVENADGNYLFEFASQYAIIKDSYTSEKAHIKSVEAMEDMFGRLAQATMRGSDY